MTKERAIAHARVLAQKRQETMFVAKDGNEYRACWCCVRPYFSVMRDGTVSEMPIPKKWART